MVDSAGSEQEPRGLRVVVVDSRPERRQMVRHLVASTGLVAPDIGEASSTAEAVEMIDPEGHDVAVVEIQMPVSLGMETIAALRGCSSGVRIVVCSFRHDAAIKEQAFAQGADAYLDKPVSFLTFKTLLGEFSMEP